MERRGIAAVAAFAALALLVTGLPMALGASAPPSAAGVTAFGGVKVITSVHDTSGRLDAQPASVPTKPSALKAAEEREGVERAEEAERESEGDADKPETDADKPETDADKPAKGDEEERQEHIHTVKHDEAATAVDDTGSGTVRPNGTVSGTAGASSTPTVASPLPTVSFEGVNNDLNPDGPTHIRPPDTNADVGPTQIVELVNQSIGVYDKQGNLAAGFPKAINVLWAGFAPGTPCREQNDGDPVVLYDQLADRWFVSQFALPNYPEGPFYQCIAISTTGDATGSYYRYQFLYDDTLFNDYGKFGVWPDGYYASFNQFSDCCFEGSGVVAYDRTRMLAGQTATAIKFISTTLDPLSGGLLPSDLNGATLPPKGAPNYYLEMEDTAFGYPTDRLQEWQFHANFNRPKKSTFTGPIVLPVKRFKAALCGFDLCIHQPGTDARLDPLSDRLMARVNYRNFGDHESLVVTHSVDVGHNIAGIRWYEVRSPGATPTVYQQGTYSPKDGSSRWMGSVNMDKAGDIAVGYSVSSDTVFPSIRYVTRTPTDRLGKLPGGEVEILAGTGSQTTPDGRWGDYTSMSVDPVDDCTFWYANEYLQQTGPEPWRTRIAAFKFPGCS